MTLLHWFEAAAVIGFIALGIAQMVGPLELRRGSKSATSESAGLRGRFAAWRRQPRAPIKAGDWLPHSGFLFLPTFIGAGLVYGGFFVLIGRHETFRLGGLLALIGGVPMVALIALYVQRPPYSETASDSIPIRPRGHDVHEVDALLLGIAGLDRDEIRRATFSKGTPGYDEGVVDALLERWATGDLPGDPGGRHRSSL